MADKDNVSNLISKIRERMIERAMSGAPYWPAPVENSARSTAGCLLVGMLLEKLPSEDASALCETLICEQNDDGSWSREIGEPGDLSLTLEAVEALSEAHQPLARDALSSAVEWLENHRSHMPFDIETVLLLRSLTELPKSNLERYLGPISRALLNHIRLRKSDYRTRPGLAQALSVLSHDKSRAFGKSRQLIEMQYVDGSWDGSSRSTIMAMLAMRHSGIALDDAALERGWRYLRALQAWDGEALVQNPCDFSNLLHATAVRSFVITGAEPDLSATSVLTLLHQQRASGGWAVGGLLPTDLYTTSLALDALSFAGDTPIETYWSRRRTVQVLTRTQHPDGGWPLYYSSRNRISTLLRFRGWPGTDGSLVDVTSLAVQALAFSGIQDAQADAAIDRGTRYLLRRQQPNGLWRADLTGGSILTTARVIEALLSASPDRTRSPVTNAVRALMRRQRSDGGWGHSHHTAAAIRALVGVPGVPSDVLKRGRKALESALKFTDSEWAVEGPVVPLPFHEPSSGAPDLITLWALEALAPVAVSDKSRRAAGRRSRSVYRGRV